jgi:hypothetical protein
MVRRPPAEGEVPGGLRFAFYGRTSTADVDGGPSGPGNVVGVAAEHPAVVVASEWMDEDPGWSAVGSGELLHVDHQLHLTRQTILDKPPGHLLTLSQLGTHAASQSAT